MTLPYAITLALGLATFMVLVLAVEVLLEYVRLRQHSRHRADMLAASALPHGNSTADDDSDDRQVHDGRCR